MSDVILDILRRYVDGTKIKKASARSGGEYHSPCPKCGGTDRFCVFPEQPAARWPCSTASPGRGLARGIARRVAMPLSC